VPAHEPLFLALQHILGKEAPGIHLIIGAFSRTSTTFIALTSNFSVELPGIEPDALLGLLAS
jgi:hypothetical protein